MTTSAPAFESVDVDTAELLTTVNADWRPFATDDRNTVAAAILDDARAHDGQVSANRVRAALAALPVLQQPAPHRVGPVYLYLRHHRVLVVDGWETSDDRQGKNAGKPCRTYRWRTT